MKLRIVNDSKEGNNRKIPEILNENLKQEFEIKVVYAKIISQKMPLSNLQMLLFLVDHFVKEKLISH